MVVPGERDGHGGSRFILPRQLNCLLSRLSCHRFLDVMLGAIFKLPSAMRSNRYYVKLVFLVASLAWVVYGIDYKFNV